MPRDGSGIYTTPPGTTAVPDTTIESAKYNNNIADVAADLNAVRPIIAGGTGANTPEGARYQLRAERSRQVVTNYDSHVWEAGSFSSAAGATNEPVAGHAFAGVCYIWGQPPENDYIVVEARDLYDNSATAPGTVYVREKDAGVWGPWKTEGKYFVAGDSDGIVSAQGDMFFGIRGVTPTSKFVVNTKADLSGVDVFQAHRNGAIYAFATAGNSASAALVKSGPANSTMNVVYGVEGVSGTIRWGLKLGNETAEAAGDIGSDFALQRHSNTGTYLGDTMVVNRATGQIDFGGNTIIRGALTLTPLATPTTGTLFFGNTNTKFLQYDSAAFILAGGPLAAEGRYGRNGPAGTYSVNVHNWYWNGSGIQAWVDAVNTGVVTVTSDYRTKKDVTDLPATWDTVKALRPIKYTQAQFTPPSNLKVQQGAGVPMFIADDVERWGFVAHELQETLVPSAATGVKDSPDTIQSPNPWTVIAALTKALQEAMTRIEALEAAASVPVR